MIFSLLAVSLGGAAGAVLRYLTNLYCVNITLFGVSLGTLLVNVIGSCAMGVLLYFFEASKLSELYRIAIFVGLLGAFTTFSTFSMEVLMHVQRSAILSAFLTVFFHNTLSILFVFLGYYSVKWA